MTLRKSIAFANQLGQGGPIPVARCQDEPFVFGTKAETLARLRPHLRRARIGDLKYFPIRRWRRDSHRIIGDIVRDFGNVPLMVRSSARSEDTSDQSMAGAFRSERLDTPWGPADLRHTIARVVASLGFRPHDQVLIQRFLTTSRFSGVVTSRVPSTGAPYFVISIEPACAGTDAVTAGKTLPRTTYVHRNGLSEPPDEHLRVILEAMRDIESIVGSDAIQVEFACEAPGTIQVFQVRRISTASTWRFATSAIAPPTRATILRSIGDLALRSPDLVGERTVLSNMADWNPAEMIGPMPRPMDLSLYRSLITQRAWRLAREAMGYRAVPSQDLLRSLAGRPYVDVRLSLNSLLPSALDPRIADYLVTSAISQLIDNPSLHDRVELDLFPTCAELDLSARLKSGLVGQLIPQGRGRVVLETLSTLTAMAVRSVTRAAGDAQPNRPSSRTRSTRGVHRPAAAKDLAHRIQRAVARTSGAPASTFAAIARHAFIAQALLRSSVRMGVFSQQRLNEFHASLSTVTGRFLRDLANVKDGRTPHEDFLSSYGHLRPSTYDIASSTYRERGLSWLLQSFDGVAQASAPAFRPTRRELQSLTRALASAGLGTVSALDLFSYARWSIESREESKFEFSRHVSHILDLIRQAGAYLKLSHDDLSCLSLRTLLSLMGTLDSPAARSKVAEAREAVIASSQSLVLPDFISSHTDLDWFRTFARSPSFVGKEPISGAAVLVSGDFDNPGSLRGKIILLERADPGCDWIFSVGALGLITSYGGPNCHMAIRCAEMGVPAAFGCGPSLFATLGAGKTILLDPRAKRVLALHAT